MSDKRKHAAHRNFQVQGDRARLFLDRSDDHDAMAAHEAVYEQDRSEAVAMLREADGFFLLTAIRDGETLGIALTSCQRPAVADFQSQTRFVQELQKSADMVAERVAEAVIRALELEDEADEEEASGGA